jgi:hypothetical protein
MLKTKEILTVFAAASTVIGASVATTLYVTNSSTEEIDAKAGNGSGRIAYNLSDAFFPCRDHIQKAIPYKLRHVTVDSRSSRYDEKDNAHVVYVDLEVIEKPGSFYSKYSYSAQAVCTVSAASNEITAFTVRKS